MAFAKTRRPASSRPAAEAAPAAAAKSAGMSTLDRVEALGKTCRVALDRGIGLSRLQVAGLRADLAIIYREVRIRG